METLASRERKLAYIADYDFDLYDRIKGGTDDEITIVYTKLQGTLNDDKKPEKIKLPTASKNDIVYSMESMFKLFYNHAKDPTEMIGKMVIKVGAQTIPVSMDYSVVRSLKTLIQMGTGYDEVSANNINLLFTDTVKTAILAAQQQKHYTMSMFVNNLALLTNNIVAQRIGKLLCEMHNLTVDKDFVLDVAGVETVEDEDEEETSSASIGIPVIPRDTLNEATEAAQTSPMEKPKKAKSSPFRRAK